MRPRLRVMSDEEARRVHRASLAILEQTGMLIDHRPARDLLHEAGAIVDHAGGIVRFPPELVEEKLRLVPRELRRCGRTPQFDVTLRCGGPIYARVAGGAVDYADLTTGVLRRARLDDWKEFVTLADALPTVASIATLHCGDVPPQLADVHSLRVLLECQRKNIVHNAFSVRNQKTMIEMMLAVRGSREELRSRPLVHHMLSPISPLFLNGDDTAQLLLACEYGIPTDVPIMPIAGATGPVTVAGTLALANAEYLGTMTLAQTAHPSHVMPYFMDPIVADMRTGGAAFGAPEVALLLAAIAQLGTELYGLPVEGIGLFSDGCADEQTLFQKALNTAALCLAGGTLNVGAGIIEGSLALSPVQLVIDDEIIAIARRLAAGVSVTPETLAVDLVRRVGPRGSFLDQEHTVEHLRTGELLPGGLFERGSREHGGRRGSGALVEAARVKAKALLARHEVEPLPGEVLKELASIVAGAESDPARTPTGG